MTWCVRATRWRRDGSGAAVKVLVHGGSLHSGSRMALAAGGLARRGHEVFWSGERPAAIAALESRAPLTRAPSGPALARLRVDVVLGGPRPLAVAARGWMTRAACMVMGLEAGAMAQWSPTERWAWSTLHAVGLVEGAEAETIRRQDHGIDLERLAFWSEDPPPPEPDATHLDTEILERACERALARHRGAAARAAVFVDRDGTLVEERGYLSDVAGLELIPGVPQAIHNLQAAGFPVVVISNQAGVGRGLFPLARVYEVMAGLRAELRAHGIELDAIYFCPHRPDEGCACRKPGTALLERASEDLQIALRRSFMVGDKRIDAETGRRAGGRGVLVRTGYGREEERTLGALAAESRPDVVCDDLAAAAAWILAREDVIGGP